MLWRCERKTPLSTMVTGARTRVSQSFQPAVSSWLSTKSATHQSEIAKSIVDAEILWYSPHYEYEWTLHSTTRSCTTFAVDLCFYSLPNKLKMVVNANETYVPQVKGEINIVRLHRVCFSFIIWNSVVLTVLLTPQNRPECKPPIGKGNNSSS